jgi:hypothetical protein
MECEFCNKSFATKIVLKTHQSKAKYCLKLQNKKSEETFQCIYCSKSFNVKYNYDVHLTGHLTDPVTVKIKEDNIKMEEELNQYRERYVKMEEDNIKMEQELNQYTEKCIKIEEEYKYQIKYLEEQYKHQIKELENIIESNTKELKIQYLTKKYVKKQTREEFKERYVVYILTTESLKKDRRYILGKAENLTNRLSTYNKTDEHEVVYYQKCGDEDSMKTVENLVFQKLKEYREQANRERFVLPEDKEVDLFIDVIKKSIEFVSI